MPIKLRKEAGILILVLIIRRFKENANPYTHMELSKRLNMESLFMKDILSELEKIGFINEILADRNGESGYQIACDPEVFTVKYFINRFEGKNEERYEDIFDNLINEDKELLEKIRKNLLLENDTLLKNI